MNYTIGLEKAERMFAQSVARCSLCATLSDGKRRFMALYNVLGARFMAVTILVEHILQAFIAGGGQGGLVGTPIFLLLSNFQISASRMQILESVATSSWQLKPLIGIISDSLYIGGYNRLPYMILTSITGIGSALLLVGLYPVSPVIFTLLLFFIFLQIATSDLLLEARYVDLTRGKPEIRPTLYSFIHFCSGLWQLASISLVGILIAYHVPLEYLYLTPILPFAILCYIVFANWVGEDVYENKRPLTNLLGGCCWFREYDDDSRVHFREIPVIGLDSSKIKENWRLFLLGLIIGLISMLMSVLGLLELSTKYLFTASVCSGFFMIACYFTLLDVQVAKILTFIVIQNMCSISLRAATFFFYTDSMESYPEGPHFTRQFYVSVMGSIGILLSMFGVLIYTTCMYNWTYRRMFFVTSSLYIITCIPNVLLFKRLNVAMGIPDIVFVLGSEVVQVVVGQLNSMPFGVMMLAICSPGTAATLYAIMAGSNNLGNAFSTYQGSFVLDCLNIKPNGNTTGETMQFQNLWIASLISLSIQVVPVFFIPCLIPDTKQTDDLITNEDDIILQEMDVCESFEKEIDDEEVY